jgi:1-deoxy-D-xylulose-5-phosphate synthase
MLVMAPADENECRQMLSTGFLHDGPAAVRYPRGKGPGVEVDPGLEPLPIGKAEKIRDGKDIALLMFGSLKDSCTEAAEALKASLVNMRFVKPLDTDMIDEIAATHSLIVTVEDNAVAGGAGSAVSEYLALQEKAPKIMHLGLPDAYIDQGEREELLSQCGLDAKGIINSVRRHQPQIFVKDHSLS